MTRPRTFEGMIDGIRVEAEFSLDGGSVVVHALRLSGTGEAMAAHSHGVISLLKETIGQAVQGKAGRN